MTAFDTLLRAVMDATYDTGYYSGKHEDGQPHHREAIAERCSATQRLQACVNALVVAAQRLRSELDPSSMADEALYRLIDTALAPFEEAPDA